MKIHRRKRIGKKRCLRTMGILMASTMVLSSSTNFVLADTKSPTEIAEGRGEGKEEKTIVYLNGKSGKDGCSGQSEDEAVKSFSEAAELAGDYGVIRICGTVTVKGEETWTLPDGVSVRRAEGFGGALVKVNGSLTLDNIIMYAEDISGEGSVEGAVEREKVSVPKSITIEEPKALKDISLAKCDGDGEFSWVDGDFVPTEYETECKVVFHPSDTEKVNYSGEKGWDEEAEVVIRSVILRVESLKQAESTQEESTPEPTPEATPEPTPETTPEPSTEVTPEATPEPTPQVTPEVTPEPAANVPPAAAPETDYQQTSQNQGEAENVPAAPVSPESGTPSGTEQPRQPQNPPAGDGAGEVGGPLEEGEPQRPSVVPEVTPGADTTAEQQPTITLTEEEMQAAAAVRNQIDFLPAEVDSYEVVEAVVEATRWYEALTEEQKAVFGEDTYKKLTEAQNKAAAWNRQCNGVTIEGDFPWYVQFQVELKNNESDPSDLPQDSADTFIAPYDMRLWDMMNNQEYQLNGQQVRITMPSPDQKLYSQLVVIHYLEDGSVEYITPIYNNDGTISFMTTSFSPYNVAGSKVLVGNTDKVYNHSSSSNRIGSTVSGSSTVKKPSGSSSSGSSGRKSSTNSSTAKTNKTTGQKTTGGVLTWNPNTGDEQPLGMYGAMAGGALFVLAGCGVLAAKKKKD